jgi:hypothetical protein
MMLSGHPEATRRGPLVVAISDIGVRIQRMRRDIATALVGSAMLSVLLFPTLAGVLL